jgi:hypothetical protein
MVPGQVWGQSGAPGTKLRRVVLPDTEMMVSSASQWRPAQQYRETPWLVGLVYKW